MTDSMSAARPAAKSAVQQAKAAHPIWLIAGKDWADLAGDARWLILLSITLLLTLAALVLGLQDAHRLAHAHEHAMAADHAVWSAQGTKSPHAAAHFGQYAHKPVSVLAVADPGIDAYAGRSVWLEAHRQNEAQFRAARDATLGARMGSLNLSFVLQTVLPLIALLLGFAAVATERAQGTLRQLLSQGLRPGHLLAGKALAAAVVLLGLVLLACAGMAAGLALGTHTLEEQPDVAGRIGGLALGYGLYLLAFLAMALAVTALVRAPNTALVGLLAFWLLNSFLAPRWVTDVVRLSDPLPSAQAFREAIAMDKRALYGHDESHPGFIALREQVLARYGVTRVEDLPVNFRGLMQRADDEAGYAVFDRHHGRLQAQIEAQDRRRASAGLVLPMLALQSVSMAMAGTDNHHHHHFIQAAEAHRRLIQDTMSQTVIDQAHPGENTFVVGPEVWARVPAFAYTPPPASWAWQAQRGPLLALAGWALLCTGALVVAARRLRVD